MDPKYLNLDIARIEKFAGCILAHPTQSWVPVIIRHPPQGCAPTGRQVILSQLARTLSTPAFGAYKIINPPPSGGIVLPDDGANLLLMDAERLDTRGWSLLQKQKSSLRILIFSEERSCARKMPQPIQPIIWKPLTPRQVKTLLVQPNVSISRTGQPDTIFQDLTEEARSYLAGLHPLSAEQVYRHLERAAHNLVARSVPRRRLIFLDVYEAVRELVELSQVIPVNGNRRSPPFSIPSTPSHLPSV